MCLIIKHCALRAQQKKFMGTCLVARGGTIFTFEDLNNEINRGGICAAFSSDYEVNQMLKVADTSDVDTPYMINDSYGEAYHQDPGKGLFSTTCIQIGWMRKFQLK